MDEGFELGSYRSGTRDNSHATHGHVGAASSHVLTHRSAEGHPTLRAKIEDARKQQAEYADSFRKAHAGYANWPDHQVIVTFTSHEISMAEIKAKAAGCSEAQSATLRSRARALEADLIPFKLIHALLAVQLG